VRREVLEPRRNLAYLRPVEEWDGAAIRQPFLCRRRICLAPFGGIKSRLARMQLLVQRRIPAAVPILAIRRRLAGNLVGSAKRRPAAGIGLPAVRVHAHVESARGVDATVAKRREKRRPLAALVLYRSAQVRPLLLEQLLLPGGLPAVASNQHGELQSAAVL